MYYCLLDLPFDVLSIILDNISQHDALHLAVTCHRAYDVAIPRILATVILRDSNSAYASRHLITATPLSIPAAQKLSGFAKTVLSDPDHYGPLVQSLEIHASAFNAPVRPGRLFAKPDYSNIPLLAVAIRHTGNLRYISIGDVEVLVQREPTIGEIFKGFERLEEVKFANIGPVSASLLADMRSRPWSVEIDGVLDHFDDVCHALRTHADSLRRLTLRECLCFATGATAAPTVWPHVHTLTLGGLAPPLTTVAEAFPLVRLAQLAHVTSVKESPPSVSWPNLDALTISTASGLPLTSAVRCITLVGERTLSPSTLSVTLSFLQQVQPVVLSCPVNIKVPSNGAFKGLATNVTSIRYLRLTACASLYGSSQGDDWTAFIQELGALAGLPLVALSLGGHRAQMVPLDSRATAHMVASILPSLRFFEVFADGGPGGSICQWFRIGSQAATDADPQRLIEEVPPSEVPAVVAYVEGLTRDSDHQSSEGGMNA